MVPPSKKRFKWFGLYSTAAIIDVVQIIVDFTGIGVAVSEVLEIITPFLLFGMFILYRIPILNKPARILGLVGVAGADAITGGIAPFWVLDVLYIHRSVKKEDAAKEAAAQEAEQLQNLSRLPLNADGRREPQGALTSSGEPKPNQTRNPDLKPLNAIGVRRPSAQPVNK